MAWCPKCKNEYRKGITICADCGVELVEELTESDTDALLYGNEDQLQALKLFMEYNELKDVEVAFDEEEGAFGLFINKADFKKAMSIVEVYTKEKQNEAVSQAMKEATPEQLEEFERQKQMAAEKPVTYQSSAERAQDNRSSGIILLSVGGVGLAVMVMGILGIIPIHFRNPYMYYGVLSAIFLLFVAMGIISLKNAKGYESKIQSENSLRESLENWCKENLKADEIDREIGGRGFSDEILYFRRYENLKNKLNTQFMNLDETFLDQFIDTYVYDLVFSAENPAE